MAYEESLRSISMNADGTLAVKTGVQGQTTPPAGYDHAGNQYRAVMITGANQVGLVTASTSPVLGVVQNKPQVTGEPATVGIHGVSKVRVNGAVAAGAVVYAAADGRGSATGVAGTDSELGVALAAAAGADELIPVLLRVN